MGLLRGREGRKGTHNDTVGSPYNIIDDTAQSSLNLFEMSRNSNCFMDSLVIGNEVLHKGIELNILQFIYESGA